jgi:Mg2+-importing ATPase
VATVLFPFTPLAELFGFSALLFSFLVMVGAIIALYIIMAEILKKVFYNVLRSRRGNI